MGGGAGGGRGPPWEEQPPSMRKGIKGESKRDIPMSLPHPHEMLDFPSNNLGGEVDKRMQKVISSLTYLMVQSRLSR